MLSLFTSVKDDHLIVLLLICLVVFCAGMAYVAISRVRTLKGLHLTAFDPESITVNNSCIKEINRLRSCFKKELPLYDELSVDKKQHKQQMVDFCDEMTPAKKKPKIKIPPKTNKQSGDAWKSIRVPKKAKVTSGDNDCEVVAVQGSVVPRYEWTDYRYHPVNEDWQGRACELLAIQFIRSFWRQDGGPNIVLTRPHLRSLKFIGGDGNCLFRALCYIISGSEDQHL